MGRAVSDRREEFPSCFDTLSFAKIPVSDIDSFNITHSVLSYKYDIQVICEKLSNSTVVIQQLLYSYV